MSVKVRILAILIAFALVPVLVGGGINYWTVYNDLSKTEREQAMFATQASANTMTILGQQMEQAAKTYGFWDDSHSAIQAKDTAWIVDNINVAADDFGIDFGITMDGTGTVLNSFGKETYTGDLRQQPLLKRAIAGEKILSGVYQAQKGLAFVGVAQVLGTKGTGVKAGYLVFGKYLTTDQIETVKKMTGSDLSVLPKAGQALVTNKQFTSNGINGSVVHSVGNGVSYLTSYTPLKDINNEEIGQLAITITANASMEARNDLLKVFLVIVIVSILLAIVIGLIAANVLIKPIVITSGLLKEVTAGDFSHEHKIESKGEIGEMLNAYNGMVGGLRVYVQGTNDSAEELANSTNMFSVNIDFLANASEEITRGVQEVASMVQNVQTNTKMTVDSVKRMTESIREISGNSLGVYELANQTAQLAESGVTEIESAVSQMNTILGQSKTMENEVVHLDENSQKVGQITEVITAIASQTNLLALNAAIEAARAGENGRGFSVVADEVRKLAEGATRAANEIKSIVFEIQKGTENVTNSILNEARSIAEGAELVRNAGQSFAEIQQAALHVTDKAMDITTETKQLASDSDDAVNIIMKAEENAVQVANSAQSIAAATQEQSASVQEVAGTIGSLNTMAQRLKDLSSKFKI
ncbi:methyl-accepting chemotaxis protein [Desulfosporosinus sp. Sb-LF]|uniref:methyl-accepting chemotaxis protein n=1 Tax=Desulfosporosinus sp. Sb-LF TaxID=2560027 RepID=UPI00130533F2|nr:methyl-accepting chemotaxis protein [Desulfosporosinus sp. Sb-LF]